jgi:hypothetical protein
MFAHDNPNCGFDRNIDRSWAEVTCLLVTFSLLKIKLLLQLLLLEFRFMLGKVERRDFDWCIEQTLFFGEDRNH